MFVISNVDQGRQRKTQWRRARLMVTGMYPLNFTIRQILSLSRFLLIVCRRLSVVLV